MGMRRECHNAIALQVSTAKKGKRHVLCVVVSRHSCGVLDLRPPG